MIRDLNNNLDGDLMIVIDRQEYWRTICAEALDEAGFTAYALAAYECASAGLRALQQRPRLVILGCAQVREEELHLLAHLHDLKMHTLVFCAALSAHDMQQLFAAKSANVALKHYEPEAILQVVHETLTILSARNSYESVLEEGI